MAINNKKKAKATRLPGGAGAYRAAFDQLTDPKSKIDVAKRWTDLLRLADALPLDVGLSSDERNDLVERVKSAYAALEPQVRAAADQLHDWVDWDKLARKLKKLRQKRDEAP